MCRARSACGGPLPAPAEQDQSDETGDKERESGWERNGAHVAGERKARVKWSLVSDVGADTRPIRGQGARAVSSYPSLKVACEIGRPCCREP